MTDYALVLSRLHPDAVWTLDGDDYDGLTWLSDGSAPSRAELDAAWPAIAAELATQQVHASRRVAYAAESDPLFFEWQRGEGTEQAWTDKVAEIKSRFPLP